MWRHVHTLRFKLAGLYLLVFSAILTTLTAIILNISQSNLRRDFDSRLQTAAEAMVDKIEKRSEEVSSESTSGIPAENPLELINPFRFPGYYFQLRRENGKIEYRSPNLGRVQLPWNDDMAAARLIGSPVFVTLRDADAAALIGNPGEVRLLTIYRESQRTPFYLQVAVNRRSVNEAVADLRRLFLALVPSGLFVAAVASWFLAGRSLRPLHKVRQIADRLSVQDLSQRFEQPPGRDEVAVMVATINRMLDRLHDAFMAQERFIAHASHELKTPLSVLLGESQVIIQKARTVEEYERFVCSVQEEVRSLAQMVDSVLTLARAEAGLPMSTADEVSLNEVILEAVEQCQPQARTHEVRIVPHLALPAGDDLEPTIIGDGDLLRLMFANLIRNAIRYTPAGMAIEIMVTLEPGEALVAVRDCGPGIPPEYINRVFDRFFRVPEKDGAFKGVGLGLTIVRGIAQLHGGSAEAANRADGGCEFTIRLSLSKKQSQS